MTDPSSPVPAVEANDALLDDFRRAVLNYGYGQVGKECLPIVEKSLSDARAAVMARMSTPTPGRAAEPDTMGEVERLTRERDEARADAERAEAERDELRDAPWPKWVTDCLTIIRKHSGYDGYDDAVQGVDLPAELEETLDEVVTRAETAEAQLATLRAEVEGKGLIDDDVEWVVNDLAELGVKIKNRFFFCYKGESLVYVDAKHDDSDTPMKWRRVFKREFGECIHPINYDDPCLVGSVSLDDSEGWQDLPAMPEHTSSFHRNRPTSGADR